MKTGKSFLSLSESVVWFAGHRNGLAAVVAIAAVWSLAGLARGLPTEWFLITDIIGTTTALFILLVMQHSQNRDMHALQVKVDELIRASDAGNHMIGVERLEAEDLTKLMRDRQAGA